MNMDLTLNLKTGEILEGDQDKEGCLVLRGYEMPFARNKAVLNTDQHFYDDIYTPFLKGATRIFEVLGEQQNDLPFPEEGLPTLEVANQPSVVEFLAHNMNKLGINMYFELVPTGDSLILMAAPMNKLLKEVNDSQNVDIKIKAIAYKVSELGGLTVFNNVESIKLFMQTFANGVLLNCLRNENVDNQENFSNFKDFLVRASFKLEYPEKGEGVTRYYN